MASPRQKLRIARRKSDAAERQTAAARLYQIEAVEQAAEAGIPKTEIADLAGVSRQTVYDILGSPSPEEAT